MVKGAINFHNALRNLMRLGFHIQQVAIRSYFIKKLYDFPPLFRCLFLALYGFDPHPFFHQSATERESSITIMKFILLFSFERVSDRQQVD